MSDDNLHPRVGALLSAYDTECAKLGCEEPRGFGSSYCLNHSNDVKIAEDVDA